MSKFLHEIALHTTSGTEAASSSETQSSSASQLASDGSAVSCTASKPTSTEVSVETRTTPEPSTSLTTLLPRDSSSVQDAHTMGGTSSGSPRSNVPLVFESILDPMLHHVTNITSSRTGTSVSESILHTLAESVLSSGMRSVASRKQYSSQPSPLVEASCISERGNTPATTRHVVEPSLSAGSDISNEQLALPVYSEVHILKSQFSDDSALVSTGDVHSASEKLDKKNKDISSVSAMESSSALSSTTLRIIGDDVPRPKRRPALESLTTPSSGRSAYMLLRSSLRPRTLQLSLRNKLVSSFVEGGQKVGQAGKRFHEEAATQSEDKRIKTKKDVKNDENIQRQKDRGMSESSQENRIEGNSGSQSSNGDSAVENDSASQGKLVAVVRKKGGYACPLHLTMFRNPMKLSQHVVSHSDVTGSSLVASGSLSPNPGGSNGRKKGSHICHICSKVFISLGKLSQHIEFHTRSSSNLEELEMTSVITGIRGGGGKRRSGHTCRVCSKVFVSPGRLSNHMYTAHPGLSGSGSDVGELATPGVSAVASVSGVKKKGNHVCPICSKVFGSPGKLSQHMYSHTGERPFACSECNKAFSSKFKLVRHALIHSSDSERRYRCNACDRSFHRKDHLQNHAKVS